MRKPLKPAQYGGVLNMNMFVCGLRILRICGVMIVVSGVILITSNLPLQVDNKRLPNPPHLKTNILPLKAENKGQINQSSVKRNTLLPKLESKRIPYPLHSKGYVLPEEVQSKRGSNPPRLSSKTSPQLAYNKRTSNPLPLKSTKSPLKNEKKIQPNPPRLSGNESPSKVKNGKLPNPSQLKQHAPPPSLTKAPKIKSQKCVPKPDCVRMSYPILQDIKEEIVKPSDKQRSIYLQTKGRFGNVLYQLGGLLGLSKATCSSIKIHSPYYNLSTIFKDLPFTSLSKSDFDRKTKDIPYFNLKEHPEEITNSYLTALNEDIKLSFSFANFSWFDGCEKYARYSLRLKDAYINKAKKIIRTVVEKHGKADATTIGVHIRRGDRATQKLFKMGYRVPQKSYFNKAMSYFRLKYKNALFIITTDDREWVTENFPNNKYPDVYLAPKNSFETDFTLLTKCDYVIQSVGTFSRWAAYLNGRESVHYRVELLRVCSSPECKAVWKLNSTESPYQKHWRTMVN